MTARDARQGHTSHRALYATGASRNQFGPIFIPAHVVRKYSASKIIAAVHFHIENSFAFSPRSIRSATLGVMHA